MYMYVIELFKLYWTLVRYKRIDMYFLTQKLIYIFFNMNKLRLRFRRESYLKKTYFWYNYTNKWSLFVENQALCNFNWYAHGNIQKSFVFNAMINIKSTSFLVTSHHRNNIIDKCLRYIVKCTFLLAILHAF